LFGVVRCPACGLASTQPQLTPDQFAEYYPDSYTAYEPPTEDRGGAIAPLGSLLDYARMETIVRYGPYRPVLRGRPPGRLLDVGCGVGDLASTFKRHGWTVFGVEPSDEAAAFAGSRGIDMHCGTLENAPWPAESFDAILFNHSLEHIPRPAEALALAAALLKEGGILAVGVPNFDCWQRRTFRSRWFQLDVPRHLQHFGVETLTELVTRAGLRPVAVKTLSMRPSLLMSLQYAVAGRAVLTGRFVRWFAWVAWPLLLAADLVARGDCLHIYAVRDGSDRGTDDGGEQ
jgi:SAM-dependent methyltransferase